MNVFLFIAYIFLLISCTRISDHPIQSQDKTVYPISTKIEFKPRKDVKALTLELPLDWGMDPYADRNWQFQLHAMRMVKINPKNERDFMLAFFYLDDWYSYHNKKTSRFQWYDMATGLRAELLANMLRNNIQNKYLSKNQKERLHRIAQAHIKKLRNEAFITIEGNHGLFQIKGLRLLCDMLREEKGCQDEKQYTERLFSILFENQFNGQGFHRENSPSYHQMALQWFSPLRELFPESFPVKTFRKAQSQFHWYKLNDHTCFMFGDSSRSCFEKNDKYPESIKKAENSWSFGDFRESNYQFVKNGESGVKFAWIGKENSLTHKHYDLLSFELFWGGVPIVVDSGKYTYDHDALREYFVGSAAHNTLTVGKKANLLPEDLNKVSHFYMKKIVNEGKRVVLDGGYFIGTDIEHQRKIVISRNGISLTDNINSQKNGTSTLNFNIHPDLQIKQISNNVLHLESPSGRKFIFSLDQKGGCSTIVGESGFYSESYKKKVKMNQIKLACQGSVISHLKIEAADQLGVLVPIQGAPSHSK
jgi:hypothetical protein